MRVECKNVSEGRAGRWAHVRQFARDGPVFIRDYPRARIVDRARGLSITRVFYIFPKELAANVRSVSRAQLRGSVR